jgi:hypothetical protein
MAQTQADFTANVDTIFRVDIGAAAPIELRLVRVKGHESDVHPRSDMERFSVFFFGPSESFLPQQTYAVAHDTLGEFAIFIVPVGQESGNYLYEAVFNFFKSPTQDASTFEAKPTQE